MKAMNPQVNILSQENRVGQETEHVYTDEFFEALSGVANALDNVEARECSHPSPIRRYLRIHVGSVSNTRL